MRGQNAQQGPMWNCIQPAQWVPRFALLYSHTGRRLIAPRKKVSEDPLQGNIPYERGFNGPIRLTQVDVGVKLQNPPGYAPKCHLGVQWVDMVELTGLKF